MTDAKPVAPSVFLSMAERAPDTRKFLAVIKDHGGCVMFQTVNGETWNAEGHYEGTDLTHEFWKDKFSLWCPLPDDFEFLSDHL